MSLTRIRFLRNSAKERKRADLSGRSSRGKLRNGGRKMDRSPIRLSLVLTATGLLGLLTTPIFSVEPPPKHEPGGTNQPGPVAQPAAKVDAKQPNATLFKNAKVFDGKSDKVSASTSVLVIGNKI